MAALRGAYRLRPRLDAIKLSYVVSAHDADEAADLDKDGQVSLLEAFLSASRRTEEFYRGDDERSRGGRRRDLGR